jgi:hypothetical protein
MKKVGKKLFESSRYAVSCVNKTKKERMGIQARMYPKSQLFGQVNESGIKIGQKQT